MKRFLLSILGLLLLIQLSPIAAQEPTVQQLFIVDIVTVQDGSTLRRIPEHFGGRGLPADVELTGVFVNKMDFGLIDAGLVSAYLTDIQQTYVCALADVICVPVDIENVIPVNQFTGISNRLEAKGIPAISLTAGDTYRSFLKELAGIFQLGQAWTGSTGVNPFDAQISLSSTVGALRVSYRNALINALDSLAYDRSALTLSSTLRQVFGAVATQSHQREFPFGTYTL